MSIYADKLMQYCKDITSGKITAGIYCKKAVRRFLNDLKKQKEEAFLYEYCQEYADSVCSFTESLKPGDLNGKKIKLLPWQIFVLSNLEGWRYKGEARKDPDTGILLEEGHNRKRFRLGYIEVNRKNGKTTGILENLTLYNFLKYPASESYLVSARDDIAEKTFKEIADMIHADKVLDEQLKPQSLAITFKDITEKSRLSFFCDGGKDIDGLKVRFAAIDEYHAYDSDKMYTSMQYGTRSKADAQVIIITTADTNINKSCYEMNQKSKRILNGIQIQEDFFSIIYSIDDNDDYKNPKVWQKANPSLKLDEYSEGIIQMDVIKADVEDALNTPAKIPELKAKTFGIWGGGTAKSWLPLEVWEKNKELKASIEDFKGGECCGGLDLSNVDDFTALSFIFCRGGFYYLFHKFYIPEDTLYNKYKKDNANIFDWVENGYITATPGATVDYNFIIKDILDMAKDYKIKALGFDKWQSSDVIKGVEAENPNILLVEVEQTLKKLSPITKAFEKDIKDGLIVDNNPVMKWMITNAELKIDENGNYKLVKSFKNSTQRIDGIISSMMSHSLMNNSEITSNNLEMSFNELKALL